MSAVIQLPAPARTIVDILAASVRMYRGTAPKADIIPVRNTAALRVVRAAVAQRARMLGATPDCTRRAHQVALRELDAGRSTAVVIALACGELTGRRNPLLNAPVGA